MPSSKKDQLIFVCETKPEADFIRRSMHVQAVYMDLRSMPINIVEQSDRSFHLVTFGASKATLEHATIWANAQWQAFQDSKTFLEAVASAMRRTVQ